MKLEQAKQNLINQLENIKKANECGLATKGEFNKDIEAIETVLQTLDNSIPREKLKEKIGELSEKLNVDDNIRIYTLKGSYELQIAILQELLEE